MQYLNVNSATRDFLPRLPHVGGLGVSDILLCPGLKEPRPSLPALQHMVLPPPCKATSGSNHGASLGGLRVKPNDDKGTWAGDQHPARLVPPPRDLAQDSPN
ncbi:hypothetical protein BHE74_00020932 [Ensete ventricosum]|uniref:Uncharacterized protein n=1 Tax=Ensete ventricosum TaxID=4639 RepID=A0A427A761_ENSVE|nr:hypothetical protein B296_00031409 [Ensete ventricosum]RWW71354.1 hypothetical protein BHE74_00020932 [Ensete ventricosum]